MWCTRCTTHTNTHTSIEIVLGNSTLPVIFWLLDSPTNNVEYEWCQFIKLHALHFESADLLFVYCCYLLSDLIIYQYNLQFNSNFRDCCQRFVILRTGNKRKEFEMLRNIFSSSIAWKCDRDREKKTKKKISSKTRRRPSTHRKV